LFGRKLIPAPAAVTATAAAAVAAATTTASPAAVAAATAVLTRLGLVDRQRPALEREIVQRVDGPLGFRAVLPRAEAAAARAAGLPVHDDLSPFDGPMLLEQRQEVVGRGTPCEVAAVNVLRHRKTFPVRSSIFAVPAQGGETPVFVPRPA